MEQVHAGVESQTGREGADVRKRLSVLWVLAVVPAALVVGVFWSAGEVQHVDDVVSLNGSWRVREGAGGEPAGAAVNDSGWSTIQLPGSYTGQGLSGASCWLRRHFDLEERLTRQSLLFLVDGTASATFEVFINGDSVGRSLLHPAGMQPEHLGPQGFQLPAEQLKAKDNVLALKVQWHQRGIDGFRGLLLVGPSSRLSEVVASAASFRRYLYGGVLALLAVLGTLILALFVIDWDADKRRLYGATFVVVTTAAANVVVYVSPYVRVPELYAVGLPLALVTLASLCVFLGEFLLGPVARVARIFAGAALVAAVPAFAELGWRSPALNQVLDGGVLPLAILLLCTFLMATAMRLVFFGRGDSDSLVGFALLCTVGAGLFDGLKDAGLFTGPRVFCLVGAPSSAIMAVMVVFADFARVALENRRLSLSLRKSNAKLQTALERAQEVSRLKSEFVATVSHELRTPLNSIINVPEGLLERFAQVRSVTCAGCSSSFELEENEVITASTQCPACQQEGTLSEQATWRYRGDLGTVAENLARVSRSGHKLLSLIDDVLDFSQLEARKSKLVLSEVVVAQAVRDVVEMLEPVAAKARVGMRVDDSDRPVSIAADRVKFSQVLINLLGNAIKFSPAGAEVVVHYHVEGDGLHLRVTDTGIGIAPEHHDTIFEPFRQVDGTATRKFGGTGLGLAITRKYVELHGGSVRVESAEGRGSTFHVLLPVAGPTSPPEKSAQDAVSPAGKTVLLLDDEPSALQTLRFALEPVGCRIVGVHDPRELEAAMAEHSPDLLIIDVVMPLISGLDVLRALRARPTSPPIVVTSAYQANADIVRALGAEWLEKPWDVPAAQAMALRLLAFDRPQNSTRLAL